MRSKIKILCFLLTAITMMSILSGCNIKFIEKAPPKPTEDTQEYGDLDAKATNDESKFIVETKEPSTEKETVQPTKEPAEKTMESIATEAETEEPTLKPSQDIISGVIFNMKSIEMYVTKNSQLYANVDLLGTAATSISAGSKVTRIGVSEDGNIAIVKMVSGTMYYMRNDLLSTNKPEPPTEPPTHSPTQKPTSKPSSSGNSSGSSSGGTSGGGSGGNTPTPTPQEPQTPKPTKAPTTPSKPKPSTPEGGGIAYPSNPRSTSINFGITFADVNFKANVLGTITMNTGPGKVLPSTGFKALATYHAGDVVQCTGIGQNGYVRAVLSDGRVGFIDGLYLKR